MMRGKEFIKMRTSSLIAKLFLFFFSFISVFHFCQLFVSGDSRFSNSDQVSCISKEITNDTFILEKKLSNNSSIEKFNSKNRTIAGRSSCQKKHLKKKVADRKRIEGHFPDKIYGVPQDKAGVFSYLGEGINYILPVNVKVKRMLLLSSIQSIACCFNIDFHKLHLNIFGSSLVVCKFFYHILFLRPPT